MIEKSLNEYKEIVNKYRNKTTEEYFNYNYFSIDAFNKKYKLTENETYFDAIERVCDYISSAEETKELQEYWKYKWMAEILEDWWHPAGSIVQGAGSEKTISLANCTTISLGTIDDKNEWDNLESIIKNAGYTTAKNAAYRQGLGIDFSKIRPRGSQVYNSSNESTGAIHWMKYIDSLGYYVGQRGRIPAMLFSLNVKHPDVLEFIDAKKDYTIIQNANISVQITDDFYECVKKDQEWTMKFEIPSVKKGEKVYIDYRSATPKHEKDDKGYYYVSVKDKPKEVIEKKESARKILELIAKGMCNNAEPGIQNIDIAKRLSNSDYVYNEKDEYDSRIVSTNACCVTYDTPILTDKGYLKIGETVGKNVNVWNGENFTETKPFLAGENQQVFRVTLSDRSYLDCTSNHKWLIEDNKKNEKRIVTEDLKEEMKICKFDFPVIDENIKDDCKHAYKHGAYCGDGQGMRDNNKGILLYGEKQKLIPHLTDRDPESFNVLKGNRIWVGLPNIGTKFDVPINNHSIKYKLSWLAGLLDTDGTLLKSPKGSNSLQISSIEEKFIYDIKLMLSTLGIKCHINLASKGGDRLLPDNKGLGKLKEYYCKPLYRICISAVETKKLLDLGLNTHRLVFNENPNDKIRDNRRFVKIKSVELIGNENVYCFTEKEKGTGCFNGILTSNSEQYLSEQSLCVLSSINVEKFDTKEDVYKDQLKNIGYSVNRFLDNTNECELKYKTYSTEQQRIAIDKLRRTGAGSTNWAAWLFKNNLEYGSKKGNEAVKTFNKWYNYYLYESSIQLGKEKGNFGLFDKENLIKSPFIQRMMKMGLNFDTLRNVTVSSIAPTGSLSLMFSDSIFSYGVEPPFGLYFWKRTRISGKYEYYFCVPNIVRETFKKYGFEIPMKSDTIRDTWDGKHGKPIVEFIEKNKDKLGIKFKNDTEIDPLDKMELMVGLMEYCDSSISVTYMLPENSDWEDVYNFILKSHEKGLKSIAAFPEKKMYGIVSKISFMDLAFKLKNEKVYLHPQNFDDKELKELNISTESIEFGSAPKRLKTLDADIYNVTANGKKYILAIGLQNNQPYEIFGGLMNGMSLKFKHKKGKISKVNRSHYKLEIGDDIEVENFAEQFKPEEQLLFRMLSTNLRHGVSIKFIIDQLHKANDSMTSLASAVTRVLKKYIQDGEKVSGQTCPSCKQENTLVYNDGCVECSNCGWTKCN